MVSAVGGGKRFSDGCAGFGHFLFAERGAFGFGNNVLRVFNFGAASVVAGDRAGINRVICVVAQNNSAGLAEACVGVDIGCVVGYGVSEGVNGVVRIAVETYRANRRIQNVHAVNVVIVRVNFN